MKLINPAHLHYLVPAALLVATAALGGSAVVDPTIACAAPREFDIQSFEDCIRDGIPEGSTLEFANFQQQACCFASGGDWVPHPEGGGDCVAPPAEPAEAPFRPLPQGPILPATPVPDPGPAAPPPSVMGPG